MWSYNRTVLHICAAYGHADMITMFLERSNQNAKASKAAQKSNADGDDKKGMEESAPADILDTNAQEWNHNLNPLQVITTPLFSVNGSKLTHGNTVLKLIS